MNTQTLCKTVRRRWAPCALATLTLMAAHAASADNSSATARDIGSNPSNYQRRDVVGVSDPMDFYRFSLSDRSAVDIRLSDISGDADIYLMGDNGTYLRSNRRGYGANEQIRQNLDAGTYRLLVYGWAGTVNHRLNINTQPSNPAGTTAAPLGSVDGSGVGPGSVVALGRIAPTTGWIDYHFTLPGPRIVDISGTGNVAAAVTPDTTPVRWNVLQGNQISGLRLRGGEHFLRVFRNPNSAEAFRFNISATPHNTNDNAGNTPALANRLGAVGDEPVAFNDYVGAYDTDDYFQVYVGPNRQLNVALEHRFDGQGADVRIIDTLGNVVRASTNAGDDPENISYDVPAAGAYLVHVNSADLNGGGEARYNIRIGTIAQGNNAPSRPRRQPNPANPGRGDAPNDLGRPAIFSGQGIGLVPGGNNGTLPHGETVGGASDNGDVLSFRVSCNRTTDTPVFTLSDPPTGVAYVLYEVVDDRPVQIPRVGLLAPRERRDVNYEFRLQVTGPLTMPVTYNAVVNQIRCENRP